MIHDSSVNKLKSIRQSSLLYHQLNDKPGKIAMTTTKPLFTQEDLSLAYSPGVAEPCIEISNDIDALFKYTARGNMVAVISNGTAVLGLGNLGAAAAKPVMEGKAALFKRFANIDAIDLVVNTSDTQELIKLVQYLKYNWGGVNLEDIKAPECFLVESELKGTVDIPVFHDDQHGTAVAVVAALINAADLTGRTDLTQIKVVINGAGAAGIACANLLKSLGIENIILCDSVGVIYKGRTKGMNSWKTMHAIDTQYRSLAEAMVGADLFLGLSVKGSLKPEMVLKMAAKPIIFALANPDPEIMPSEALAIAPDAIIATGRSDFANQINNVIVFPYIFRGALDTMAVTINEEMKIAAAKEIALLTRQVVPQEVIAAHSYASMQYGANYIVPSIFDPRLISTVSVAVAAAAMQSGVARKHVNLDKYKLQLINGMQTDLS